jgi:serine/threonine protein kinase
VALTVENVCGSLVKGRLMTPDEMKAMQQRWRSDAGDVANQLVPFIRWLVAKGYVTEYQANLLAKGHSEEFFLNQYKILERIGRGRMAGVYKAVHSLGQIVAIKVLPPSRAKNPQTFARFQREARLSVRLKHPNVVRAFQVGATGTLHFLVMEYLEGETLEEVLKRRKRLPPDEAVRLVHQVLLGLQHVHEQGLIHRDIKPSNLMLVPAPTEAEGFITLKSSVKILDIGLAREFFDENAPDKPADSELTAEGTLLGTPDYLAPEQARDARTIDIRADIYSTGCVLYHLLSGQPPFPDKNIFNQMLRHATETAKPLKDFNPAVPDGLEQIVRWMMAKDPAQRYPTPARAAQALEVFLIVGSEAPVTAGPPPLDKFLTWLESEEGGEEEAAPAPPKPAAAAPPVATAVPVAPPPKPKSSPTMPSADAFKNLGKKVKAGTPETGAEEFDVELVPVPKPREGGPLFNRRDFLMMGLGAGAVLLVFGFFACVIGIIHRIFNPPSAAEPEHHHDKEH